MCPCLIYLTYLICWFIARLKPNLPLHSGWKSQDRGYLILFLLKITVVVNSKIKAINRIKMRNWYILSPMKIPKQQFYNFWVKFSICKYHTRRNFINFWLRRGGKKIWIFAGFPDYWLKTDSEEASEFRVYKKCSQD